MNVCVFCCCSKTELNTFVDHLLVKSSSGTVLYVAALFVRQLVTCRALELVRESEKVREHVARSLVCYVMASVVWQLPLVGRCSFLYDWR